MLHKRESEHFIRKLFPHHEFSRSKPKWLTHNLELEIYNDSLKIAVEYQGHEHYEYHHDIHKNKVGFKYQNRMNKLKAKLCKQNGVCLVVVPYFCVNIPKYITHVLAQHHII